MNLFLVPYAGGNRYSLNYIRKCIPAGVSPHPLELPGRGPRIDEPLLDDLGDMVDDLYAQALPFMDGPYAVFGHCMGGLLAFLLARKMVIEQGPLPAHIFVAGCKGPSAFSGPRNKEPDQEELKRMLYNSGTAPELIANADFFGMVEPVMRADLHGFYHYIYEAFSPLNLPLSVIIDERNHLKEEEAGSWQRETVLPVKIYRMPGMLKDTLPALSGVFEQAFSSLQ